MVFAFDIICEFGVVLHTKGPKHIVEKRAVSLPEVVSAVIILLSDKDEPFTYAFIADFSFVIDGNRLETTAVVVRPKDSELSFISQYSNYYCGMT
ncbi:MAG: hypothetical protein J6L73_01790 [Muribaculaceae bacterium]|nr:hypothetical protein [Muribaculaceae bacterium]